MYNDNFLLIIFSGLLFPPLVSEKSYLYSSLKYAQSTFVLLLTLTYLAKMDHLKQYWSLFSGIDDRFINHNSVEMVKSAKPIIHKQPPIFIKSDVDFCKFCTAIQLYCGTHDFTCVTNTSRINFQSRF